MINYNNLLAIRSCKTVVQTKLSSIMAQLTTEETNILK